MKSLPGDYQPGRSTVVAVGAAMAATATPMCMDFHAYGVFLGVPCIGVLLIASFVASMFDSTRSQPLRATGLLAPALFMYFIVRLLGAALILPPPYSHPGLEWIHGLKVRWLVLTAAGFAINVAAIAAFVRRRGTRPDVLLLLVGCFAIPIGLSDLSRTAMELAFEGRRLFVVFAFWMVASCVCLTIVAFGRVTVPRIEGWRERLYGWMSVATACLSILCLLFARQPNDPSSALDVYHLSALERLYGPQGAEWRQALSIVALSCSALILAAGCRVLITSSARGVAS